MLIILSGFKIHGVQHAHIGVSRGEGAHRNETKTLVQSGTARSGCLQICGGTVKAVNRVTQKLRSNPKTLSSLPHRNRVQIPVLKLRTVLVQFTILSHHMPHSTRSQDPHELRVISKLLFDIGLLIFGRKPQGGTQNLSVEINGDVYTSARHIGAFELDFKTCAQFIFLRFFAQDLVHIGVVQERLGERIKNLRYFFWTSLADGVWGGIHDDHLSCGWVLAIGWAGFSSPLNLCIFMQKTLTYITLSNSPEANKEVRHISAQRHTPFNVTRNSAKPLSPQRKTWHPIRDFHDGVPRTLCTSERKFMSRSVKSMPKFSL